MTALYLGSLTVPDWAIDSNRHVNNLAYLHWMQHASLAHSAANGWSIERYLAKGWSWVVRQHAIDYLNPSFAGERLAVFTWVSRVGTSSSRRRYQFWREADGQAVAEAHSTFVFVDAAAGRSQPIPPEIRQALPPLDGAEEALPALLAEGGPRALQTVRVAREQGLSPAGLFVDPRPLDELPPAFQFQRL